MEKIAMILNFIGKQSFAVEAMKTAGGNNSATFHITRTPDIDANIDIIQDAKAYTFNNCTHEIYSKEILPSDKSLVVILLNR